MKVVRILQVLTIMNRGGAETMVMNYYRNIDRSRVQFDFLLHREEEGAFDKEIESLGGKIYRLQPIRYTNLGAYTKALDQFFKTNPDYQIIHSHLNALSIFVLRAAKRNNVPIRIAHSHTSLYNLNLNPFSKERHSINFAFKFLVQNLFKKVITSYANHYFACGEKAGDWLFGKKNQRNVRIINNAIHTDVFVYKQEQALAIKGELNIQNKFVIGHVGNFTPEKNHQFILKVLFEIVQKNQNVVLLLVGGGNSEPIKKEAESLGIKKYIRFMGVRNDVSSLMQAMDVFLFPSTNEGVPVTLIEAQASGLTILASKGVSSEVDITNLITFESLQTHPAIWGERLMKLSENQRQNTKRFISKNGYDIQSNADNLQKFYLNTLN